MDCHGELMLPARNRQTHHAGAPHAWAPSFGHLDALDSPTDPWISNLIVKGQIPNQATLVAADAAKRVALCGSDVTLAVCAGAKWKAKAQVEREDRILRKIRPLPKQIENRSTDPLPNGYGSKNRYQNGTHGPKPA